MNIKRKIKMMDALVVILFMMVIAFIVTMICVFLRMGSVPDTLIISTFAWMGFEAGIMGWIKTTKERLNTILEKEMAKNAGCNGAADDFGSNDESDNRSSKKEPGIRKVPGQPDSSSDRRSNRRSDLRRVPDFK